MAQNIIIKKAKADGKETLLNITGAQEVVEQEHEVLQISKDCVLKTGYVNAGSLKFGHILIQKGSEVFDYFYDKNDFATFDPGYIIELAVALNYVINEREKAIGYYAKEEFESKKNTLIGFLKNGTVYRTSVTAVVGLNNMPKVIKKFENFSKRHSAVVERKGKAQALKNSILARFGSIKEKFELKKEYKAAKKQAKAEEKAAKKSLFEEKNDWTNTEDLNANSENAMVDSELIQ